MINFENHRIGGTSESHKWLPPVNYLGKLSGTSCSSGIPQLLDTELRLNWNFWRWDWGFSIFLKLLKWFQCAVKVKDPRAMNYRKEILMSWKYLHLTSSFFLHISILPNLGIRLLKRTFKMVPLLSDAFLVHICFNILITCIISSFPG